MPPLGVFLVLVAGPKGPVDVVAPDPLARQLDTYVSRHVPFGYSGTILVARGGRILLNKGYGLADDARKVRNSAETVHSLGSVTKQFTATAILKLEEMGRLQVEDPISKYLPDVPADKAEITIHQLLRHTAGIVDALGDDYEKAERDETVRKALAAPLTGKPGAAYEYSNLGYSLLAAIVERTSGQTYEAFLREKLWLPAGMTKTGYRLPDWRRETLASAYRNGKRTPPNPELIYPSWNVMGNGEVLSTTGDVYRWHRALADGKVLGRSSLGKMLTPGDQAYGYGWVVSKSKHGQLITHNGGSGIGTSCVVLRFPESDTVVIGFGNRDGSEVFRSWAEDRLAEAAFGDPVPTPPALRLGDVKSERIAGVFRATGGGEVSVSTVGPRLRVSPRDTVAARLLLGANFIADPAVVRRADELFQGLVTGSEERAKPSLAAATNIQGVLARFRTDLANAEEENGKLRRIEALYAVRTAAARWDTEIPMRFEFERRTVFLSSFWKDGTYYGRNRTARPEPYSLWAAPDRSGDLVAYDPQTGFTARFRFDPKAGTLTSRSPSPITFTKTPG